MLTRPSAKNNQSICSMNTCTAVSDEAMAAWFRPALLEVLGDALKVMTWECEKISALLKAGSELVDDTFVRNWFAAFLGRELPNGRVRTWSTFSTFPVARLD